ncbi:hypothetical protein ANN_11447 [Periplaneta americana]|uniref:Uncharacterized protein n=1 Tax=Periplaneta americana TaxID=6978 RepID=A0ABQ8T673_PERAM|nr:hypothetical protein ANN_11447 [Periplaneta americana]
MDRAAIPAPLTDLRPVLHSPRPRGPSGEWAVDEAPPWATSSIPSKVYNNSRPQNQDLTATMHQDLEAAINHIKSGLPKNAAAKKHNVPRAAIQFHLKQNFVKSRPDPNTILTDEEEITLKKWIIDSCRKGFPRRKADVIASVKEFLHNRPNQFIDNTPASGLVVPPMVVFLYKRIPAEIGHSVPDSWGIGHSDRGWMKTEVFYEYVGNVFVSFLKEKNI